MGAWKRCLKAAVAIGTAVALMLTAGGCGSGNSGGSTLQGQVVSGSGQITGILSVDVGNTSFYEWSDQISGVVMEGACQGVVLSKESAELFPKLETALADLNKVKLAEMDAFKSDYLPNAEEDIISMGSDYGHYTYSTVANVRRADAESALSIMYATSSYALGPHGYTGYDAVNLDPATGDQLKLDDVVEDVPEFLEDVACRIEDEYPDIFYEGEDGKLVTSMDIDLHEYLQDNYSQGYEPVWCLSYSGLEVILNTYDVASYAEGNQTILIPYSDLDLTDDKYAKVPDSFAMPIDLYGSEPICDIDGDGKADSIYVFADSSDDEYDDFFDTLYISVGQPEYDDNYNPICYKEDIFSYDLSASFAHTKRGDFLYVTFTYENDWHSVCCYSLKGGNVENIGYHDGSFHADQNDAFDYTTGVMTDPNHFAMETRTDVLGTQNIAIDCAIGSDGLIKDIGDAFYYTEDRELTLKQDMTFELVDPDTLKPTGMTIDLKEGTLLYGYRTNVDDWADMITADGEIVRAEVDLSEWPYRVNGVDAEVLFEGIMYAG